ncbi:hypothetical protein N7492_001798 [Penicillium capsulatum]|uniref:F-box domain-containing protein n=1 Tax=Penicillium capsulatum TaxID=69766 RepID=A0A9W9IUI2_9EURO|nr:hypothetical protein N7492_001798 [Penicillium capsulatum]KAJ6129152.1 hypothetical protein N7512_001932 [Penicillium capsulatum]
MQVSPYFINGPTCLAQLGAFAKLPPELRLMIWEELFCFIPSIPHEASQPSSNILSILRCSRYLYHEITDHLYKDLKSTIQPWPVWEENKSMVLWLSSKKVSAFRQIKNLDTARQFICTFPFDKVHQSRLGINIPAACGGDPARIIILWRKINALVATINTLQCIPFVHVILSGKWRLGGKPRESIKDSNGARPDHDIAILPFSRLDSWGFSLPKHLEEAIANQPTISQNSIISQLKAKKLLPAGSPHHIDMSNPIIDIDQWLSETDTFLESRIDTIHGSTASYLRLKRFKQWYGVNHDWEEAYRQRLVQLPDCRIELNYGIQASA